MPKKELEKLTWFGRLCATMKSKPQPTVEELMVHIGEQHHEIVRYLSGSINELHRDLNKLRHEFNELEQRVWRLEEHTPAEEMARVKSKVAAYTGRFEELVRKYKPDTNDGKPPFTATEVPLNS